MQGRRLPGPAAAVAAGTAALLLRLPFLSPHPEGWDSVDFALGLERFDLLAFQPHFPGYPVYLLLARLLPAPPDFSPFLRLSLLSALASAAAAAALFLLTVPLLGRRRALLAALLLAAAPLSVLLGSMPMSDAAGLALALIAFLPAARRVTASRLALAGGLAGIALGIRLSYAPLFLALVLAARRAGGAERVRNTAALAGGFAAGTACWWIPLQLHTGPALLAELAWGFVHGHLTDWGGSAFAGLGENAPAGATGTSGGPAWSAAAAGLGERAFRILAVNLAGHGLGFPAPGLPISSGMPALVSAWGGLAAAVILSAGAVLRFRSSQPAGRGNPAGPSATPSADPGGRGLRPAEWLLGAAFPYFLWAWLVQNPEQPRHILPLLAVAVVLLAAAAPGPGAFRRRHDAAEGSGDSPGRRGRLFSLLLSSAPPAAGLALPVLLAAHAVPLAAAHPHEPPAAVQLAEYLDRSLPERSVVYTWEEERTIRRLAPRIRTERLRSPGAFADSLLAVPAASSPAVFATDRMLEGLGPEGEGARSRFRPVARFKSDPRLHPGYTVVTLYQADAGLRRWAEGFRAESGGAH